MFWLFPLLYHSSYLTPILSHHYWSQHFTHTHTHRHTHTRTHRHRHIHTHTHTHTHTHIQIVLFFSISVSFPFSFVPNTQSISLPSLFYPLGGALKLTPEHIQGLSTGDPSRSLESLIAGGVIEYVDVNEENNCLVALDESDITKGTFVLMYMTYKRHQWYRSIWYILILSIQRGNLQHPLLPLLPCSFQFITGIYAPFAHSTHMSVCLSIFPSLHLPHILLLYQSFYSCYPLVHTFLSP